MSVFLSVPVTRFSRKIILKEYGMEPIQVNRKHPLWVFIRPYVAGDHAGSGHIAADRCAHINIAVKHSIKHLLRSHLNDAGLALHRHHVDCMLRWTWASTCNGVPALRALKSFYNLYDIEDDDYDLGSAFRMWQRYRQWLDENFEGKVVNKNRIDVLLFSLPGDEYQDPPDESMLDNLTERTIEEVMTAVPNLPDYVPTQIGIWTHVYRGGWRVDAAAQKFKRSINRTYIALNRINTLRKKQPDFLEAMNAAMKKETLKIDS